MQNQQMPPYGYYDPILGQQMMQPVGMDPMMMNQPGMMDYGNMQPGMMNFDGGVSQGIPLTAPI